MSAYIVKYITMDRVASYVAKRREIEIWDENDKLTTKMKKLITDLWNLNLLSLKERYGEKVNYDGYIKKYKYTYQQINKSDNKNLINFFKSLANYTYQSCEGKSDKTKLYKEICKYEKDLAVDIVYNTKEWKEGAWE